MFRSFRFLITALLISAASFAQQIDSSLYQNMKWRSIGPFRAGRVSAVAGVPGNNAIFYIGTPGGGVWKTMDTGQTWQPISDDVKIASIGAVVVAQSNTNIIYVGTGEQTQGNGVYKSTDAGATWKSIGLENTHFISGIIVDPKNPDLVLVAAMGDSFSGADRGVFRSSDGGKTWQKTLFRDNDTAVMDINSDLRVPKMVYATTLFRLSGPPAPGTPPPPKQDAAIWRSSDEGATFVQVAGRGLPSEAMNKTGIAVIPGTKGMGLYLIATQGVFRSDDGGENWHQTTHDPRIVGSGYFGKIFVDPNNANDVYIAQTSMYRSRDGAKTWEAWQGAPSGDDYHLIWIDPTNSQSMLIGVDQGAIISVNGGKTWSSWYNQATGQFYHVSTDNQYPYYIYASQQDSGTVVAASRSDFGELSFRDWSTAGGMEFAYITPDPLNTNYIYTGGWYGAVARFDKSTAQLMHVFVQTEKYRTAIDPPIVFSPQDPRTLYIGAQFVMRTSDGGVTWQEASPDLTVLPTAANAAPGRGRGQGGGVIQTLALSPVKAGVMWAGTTNGLIQVTANGTDWQNVTPAGLPPRSRIFRVEASQHDAAEAYAVVLPFRDMHPYFYRTKDYGKNWQNIGVSLPADAIARVVREDTVRAGLLYAGTEKAVYVSFDDGDHWQPLQLNLPTTSMRDLNVHGDDLVLATFGRSLYVLDDLTPLRQISADIASKSAYLFKPQNALRWRWDMNQDTPLPIETPTGQNPPDGVVFDYELQSVPSGEIKLAIYDAQDHLVREFSSNPPAEKFLPANAPEYWFAPPYQLTKTKGHNRFVWNLRYDPPKSLPYSYYGNILDYIEYTYADHAIPADTPREMTAGPLIVPGEYTVALTINGETFKQPLTVKLDPRVSTPLADLDVQLIAEKNISAQMAADYDGYYQAAALRDAIADRVKSLGGYPEVKPAQSTNTSPNSAATVPVQETPKDYPNKDVLEALKALDTETEKISDGSRGELGIGPQNRELARLAFMIETGDSRPAAALQVAVDQLCPMSGKKLASWRDLNAQKIAPLNDLLKQRNLAALPIASNIPADPPCGK